MLGQNIRGRILIVDDNAAQLALQRAFLEAESYYVCQAENGLEALGMLAQESFDAVLLDLKMPGLGGDKVCELIRKNPKLNLLPVIIVTGSIDDDELCKSLAAGANDFIRKPYRSIELVARVNSAVRQKRKTEELDNAESLLFALARMVEAKDEATGNHCSRLSHSAVVFGEALGLDAASLNALRRGGVMHDIGKLAVPDSILMKNGPLNDAEWKIMKQHTVVGAQLCQGLKSMEPVMPIIRSHHERWQGGGYPDNLQGADIPLLARVFQIVDIYDALSHDRPYKKAWPRDRVVAMFQEEMEKGWRDPYLTEAFLDILRLEPETLLVPERMEKDLSEKIFEEIMHSGVLESLR